MENIFITTSFLNSENVGIFLIADFPPTHETFSACHLFHLFIDMVASDVAHSLQLLNNTHDTTGSNVSQPGNAEIESKQ